MILPEIAPRVEKLRAEYERCPMMAHRLSYAKERRQWLLFRRGWEEHPEIDHMILRRAYADAYVVAHMQPVFTEGELLVGQPDFTPLTPAEEAEMRQPLSCPIPDVPGRTDHMSLDFEKLLRLGVNGMIGEIRAKPDADTNPFYVGAAAELRALLTLAERYSQEALTRGWDDIADVLRNVPANPARTFREALQSIHFYSFSLWGLYQAGRVDRYLYPYYRHDIDAGILTVEEAQELIDCFCLMYSTYITASSSVGFMIGGRDRAGNAVENELTWLFLNSIPHTRTADPSIGLCVTEETTPELMLEACRIIGEGCTHPAFYGDKLITESLLANGHPIEDARDYIHCCCVEITAAAKSAIWTVSPYHNLLQLLLDVLSETESAEDLEAILRQYEIRLRQTVRAGNDQENRWQAYRAENGGEPLRVSCLVDDCIARGKSVNEGGAVYNQIQPDFLGIFNVVDSLAAVETLVFREKSLTLSALNRILAKNFEGHEALRHRIHSTLPHFGNNEPLTNRLAARLTEMIADACRPLSTFRGAAVNPAAFSYNEHIRHGANTGASPDGRLAGEPLCDGTNPVQGHDTEGPTAMLLSAMSWNHAPFLGGIAFNLELAESQARPEVIRALVESYIAGGGMEIQINVVDKSVLEDAKQHPDKHRNLVVRIGGYSDYFTRLPAALQDEIITRNRH